MPDQALPMTHRAPGRARRALRVTARRLAAVALMALAVAPAAGSTAQRVFRIDHVVDGDTVALTTGARVRLVQIDSPEIYAETQCYGPQASAVTKRLLPPGTPVTLATEPATDAIDRYGRLLRYVVRARDGLDVNVHLVRVGAASPYFYDHRLGRYAGLLQRLALQARRLHLGLWGRCPHTPYDPYKRIATRP